MIKKTLGYIFKYGYLVVTLALAILKWCGKITCSWWWITSPIWAPIVFTILVYIFVLLSIRKHGKGSQK